MITLIVICCAAILAVGLLVWFQLHRRLPIIGECEIRGCGTKLTMANIHAVVETMARTNALADPEMVTPGAVSGMSAEFCSQHCPGGCLQGCETPRGAA